MTDLARVKRNVAKMASMGAPVEDIDGYIESEGTTIDAVKAYKPASSQAESIAAQYANPRPFEEQLALITPDSNTFAAATQGLKDAAGGRLMAGLAGGATEAVGELARGRLPTMEGLGAAYQQGRDEFKAKTAEMEKSNPVAAGIGNVAGIFGAAGPTAGAGTGLASRMIQKAGAAGPVVDAAIAGTALGGASAAGRSDANSLGEFAGDVGTGMAVGGMTGAAVPVVIGGVRYLVDVAKGTIAPFTRAGQEKIVGNALNKMAGDPAAAQAALRGTTELVPGSQPTLAEAAKDAGLAVTQRGLENAGDTAFNTQLAARRAANDQARRTAADAVAPSGANAQTVADFFKTKLDDFTGNTRPIIERAQQKAQARVQALGPGTTPEAAGAIIRQEYQSALKEAKGLTSAAFETAEKAAEGATVPLLSSKMRVSDSMAKYYGTGGGKPPGEIADLADDFAKLDQAVDLTTLGRVRSRAAALAGSPSLDPRAKAVAASVQSAVDDAIARAVDKPGPGLTQEAADAYKIARGQRALQGEQFERGASGRVGATKAYGEAALSSAEVPAAYFNASRGGPDDAAKFVQTFGGKRADAEQALADYAVGDLLRAASKADGSLDVNRWRAWMDRHAGALRQFPDLYQKMRSAESAQRLADGLVGRQTRAIDEIEKGAAGLFLKQDPQKAIQSALGAKDATTKMAELARMTAGDPQASAGLKRALVDELMERASLTGTHQATGERVLSSAGYGSFLRDNAAAIRAAGIGPSQMQALVSIGDDLARAAQAANAGRPAGTNTAQNLASKNVLSALLFGSERAALSQPVQQVAGRPLGFIYRGSEQEMQGILREAFLDPKLALSLMEKATPQKVQKAGNMLAQRLGIVAGGRAGGATATQEGTI